MNVLGILLRHFLDSNADLSVTVTGRVDGTVRATTQQHTLALVIQLILVLYIRINIIIIIIIIAIIMIIVPTSESSSLVLLRISKSC